MEFKREFFNYPLAREIEYGQNLGARPRFGPHQWTGGYLAELVWAVCSVQRIKSSFIWGKPWTTLFNSRFRPGSGRYIRGGIIFKAIFNICKAVQILKANNTISQSSDQKVPTYHIQQLGPDSIRIIAISHGRTSAVAQACGLVGLELTRVTKILKDRPSWFRDC
ncbi:hypothetical protein LguiA_033105 [Lonicera macranthoides]